MLAAAGIDIERLRAGTDILIRNIKTGHRMRVRDLTAGRKIAIENLDVGHSEKTRNGGRSQRGTVRPLFEHLYARRDLIINYDGRATIALAAN